MIYVTKILCYLPNNGDAIYEFHPPKTKAGKRNIPMSKLVKETLLNQKKWHDRVSSRFAPRQGLENLVFTSKTNNPLHNTNIRESIDYLVGKINKQYPDVEFKRFTPHCLRHSHATIFCCFFTFLLLISLIFCGILTAFLVLYNIPISVDTKRF